MIRLLSLMLTGLFLFVGGAAHAATPAEKCAAVRGTDFSHVADAPMSITTAAIITYGPDKREVCQIEGVITPTIGFKIILPTSAWNGKYLQGGCGGACGTTSCSGATTPSAAATPAWDRTWATRAGSATGGGAPTIFSCRAISASAVRMSPRSRAKR